jgi:hypothetical protein
MKTRKPLTDEEGEVRELLMEDIKRFRPIAEGISPSLAAKLGIPLKSTGKSGAESKIRSRRTTLPRMRGRVVIKTDGGA